MSSRPEHIPLVIGADAKDVDQLVADRIAACMRRCEDAGRPCVLGLATGSTPTGVYAELIRRHQQERLSFRNVWTFNLDEYWPMDPNALQSYQRFMREHLFDHIDIDPQRCHVPDGRLSSDNVLAACDAYEEKILAAGGLDLQLLGIGRTGHIGFNEPGSGPDSRTRMIWLDAITRRDAASDFFGEHFVPRRAITMGVGTILEAKEVVMVAYGEGKAPIIRHAVEGEVTERIPATFLQHHPHATVFLDASAASDLRRCRQPWTLGAVTWNDRTIRKAVIGLARQLNRPILKLTDEDYNEHHLQELLAEHGPAYNINIKVFRSMQRTITGWPGGKPTTERREGDAPHPRDAIFPKRVLVFSPHPDDDVISMGGTLIRLCDHGHDVHVAYQTSGNIAVFDDDVVRALDLSLDLAQLTGSATSPLTDWVQNAKAELSNKSPGEIDGANILAIKGRIRRNEAIAGARAAGVPEDHCHFLDLPFYETGRVTKKSLGAEDVAITAEMLRTVQPHLIFAAGDLSDPHGTHRTCLDCIFQAIEIVRGDEWFQDSVVWLYRGAWQEWEPEQIEMAVPLSPEELDRKIAAIHKHESQKDKALFPGNDPREFWQRAEDRNRELAETYDALGFAEYEAMEAFVEYRPGE